MIETILTAMKSDKMLPTVLVAIDILAAGRYALNGMEDWRKVVYWLAAAALTFVVTY